MSNKVFVGGLDYGVDERQLREVFSQFGLVKNVKLCKDPVTQKSRGFAFITYAEEKDAQEAISKMDGQLIGERTVGVSEAIEKKKPINS